MLLGLVNSMYWQTSIIPEIDANDIFGKKTIIVTYFIFYFSFLGWQLYWVPVAVTIARSVEAPSYQVKLSISSSTIPVIFGIFSTHIKYNSLMTGIIMVIAGEMPSSTIPFMILFSVFWIPSLTRTRQRLFILGSLCKSQNQKNNLKLYEFPCQSHWVLYKM